MRFLGLDIGTTRMKCGVYNEQGELEYADLVDYGEKNTGKESYVDIEAVLSSALALLGKAYKACAFDSIAVSSIGESFVLLDEKDEVLFYPMLYTDPRGKKEADAQAENAEQFFLVAGVYPQGMYSAYKLAWIKNGYPEIYAKAKKALLVNEYISYKLTGVRAIDYAQASRTGVFDIRKKEFSPALCALLGINENLFSPAGASGKKVGEVRETIAKEWGVKTPITVVAGGHDQVCATLGSGVTESGLCSDGMGTVECLTAVYGAPSSNCAMGKYGYPIVPFLENLYCTYLLNYSCGSLTRWWLSSCFDEEAIKSGKAFVEMEKDFTDEPTGILVLPYFAGAATPYQDLNAKGGIVNLSLSDTPSRVYQGVLEGLCFEMKLNLATASAFGVRAQKLVATGGGSSSKKWLQMKADILGIPVYPLKTKEAGVCGAAMLGASALLGEDLQTLAKRFVQLETPVLPRKEVTERYEREYEKYEKWYQALKVFF